MNLGVQPLMIFLHDTLTLDSRLLMDFYRECLFAHCMHPTVMLDMIKLSKDTSHGYSTIAFDMIHDAIASGKMWLHNQKNVDKHFNTLHGKLPREKLQR
jgi:hypothetical protein